jgi:hypothetical protein
VGDFFFTETATGNMDAMYVAKLFAFGCEPGGKIHKKHPTIIGYQVTRSGSGRAAILTLIGADGAAVGTTKGGETPRLVGVPTAQKLHMLQLPPAGPARERLLGSFVDKVMGPLLFKCIVLEPLFAKTFIEVCALPNSKHTAHRCPRLMPAPSWQCASSAEAVDSVRRFLKLNAAGKRHLVKLATTNACLSEAASFRGRPQVWCLTLPTLPVAV